MKYSILLVASTLVLATAASAKDISVRAGQTVEIDGWAHSNTDCKPTGFVSYRVDSAPKLGKVNSRRKGIVLRTVDTDSLKGCIGKSVPGVALFYRAGKTPGEDRFSVVRINRHGRETSIDFRVTVR